MGEHDEQVEKIASVIEHALQSSQYFTSMYNGRSKDASAALRDAARAAIAAIGDGWRDVASAPRANIVDGDGPRILVTWENHKGHISIARHGRCPANDGITWFTDSGLPCGSTPTHWQHLPAALGEKP